MPGPTKALAGERSMASRSEAISSSATVAGSASAKAARSSAARSAGSASVRSRVVAARMSPRAASICACITVWLATVARSPDEPVKKSTSAAAASRSWTKTATLFAIPAIVEGVAPLSSAMMSRRPPSLPRPNTAKARASSAIGSSAGRPSSRMRPVSLRSAFVSPSAAAMRARWMSAPMSPSSVARSARVRSHIARDRRADSPRVGFQW